MNLACKNVAFSTMNNPDNAAAITCHRLNNSFRISYRIIDVSYEIYWVTIVTCRTPFLIEISITCHIKGNMVQPFGITSYIVLQT